MATADQIVLYGGTVHHWFAEEVVRLVNVQGRMTLSFTHVWHSRFPDREPGFYLTKPKNIQDRHVIFFACPISAKLELELRDMVRAAKGQYGAATVTVVLPFLRYRRQDRSEKVHEITRLRWFFADLRAWGVDSLIVCEPHSLHNTQKYADEFGLKLLVADPTRLFADALRPQIQTAGGTEHFRVYGPDFGSVGRALRLGNELGIGVLATPKIRGADGKIVLPESSDFLAQVRERFGENARVSCALEEANGKTLITREDEVDTARTATDTMKRLKTAGAKAGWLAATHPVCSPGWKNYLWPHEEEPAFDAVWFGNTRPRGVEETRYEGSSAGRVTTVPIQPVIAEALLKVITALP